jgi:phage terminase large subunit-like protein
VTTYAEALAEVEAAIERRASGERLEEEAARLGADFRAFVEAAWALLIPIPFVPTWHVDVLCEHYQAALQREIDRLLITIQPGSLKSSIISVFGPAWRWTHEPQERIVSASHSDDLATRDTRRSRMLMQTAWYMARWGDRFDFASDENLKTRYSNNRGGHRVRTHVLGGTGERGTVLQLDDPHNAQEAHSDNQLQAAKDWWGETWASRLDDSVDARGVKIVIGQRIHEADLIGHLLSNDEDAGRWTHLCLPTRYERKHPYRYPTKAKLKSGRTIKGDPRRKEGALLMPTYMDEERLADKTSDMSAHVFAGQYQQRPAPREGRLLKRADWRYYDPNLSFYAPRGTFGAEEAAELNSRVGYFTSIVHSWDTSVKDRAHSDFVAAGLWGCTGAHRFGLRFWHERAGLNATIEAMLELYAWAVRCWPQTAHYVLIENSANGPDAAAEIKSRVQGVILSTVSGSKWQRAEAAEPALTGHNCYLPGYADDTGEGYDARTPSDVQEFIEETATFPTGAHDDHVDQWSSMVNWTRERGGAAEISVPRGTISPPKFLTPSSLGTRDTRYRPPIRTGA